MLRVENDLAMYRLQQIVYTIVKDLGNLRNTCEHKDKKTARLEKQHA